MDSSFWSLFSVKEKKSLFYWLNNFKCHPNVIFKVDENTLSTEMSDSNDVNPSENMSVFTQNSIKRWCNTVNVF